MTVIPLYPIQLKTKPLIYLDNNSTTRPDDRVIEVMLPWLRENYANPSSGHLFGFEAAEAVKTARAQVSSLIGASPNDIIFTSGATESINLAIRAIAAAFRSRGRHIITLQTEHRAVLDTCRFLERSGFEVSYLPVNPAGSLDLEIFKSAFRPDTILVSMMQVNNETGVIQPVEELAEIAHAHNAVFFSDTTQSFGKMPLSIQHSQIDLLCFSAHKFYGPKGTGGLYINPKISSTTNLQAIVYGGGQERGLRSGTLNVPGIVGTGMAAEIASLEMNSDMKRIKKLNEILESELLKSGASLANGDKTVRLGNVSNIMFPDLDSAEMVLQLSMPADGQPAIAISSGSACSANSTRPSHVLKAMGLGTAQANSSLRFSLSKYNTEAEIRQAVGIIRARLGITTSETTY